MSYNGDEISIENGNPIELYVFYYAGTRYLYTSSKYPISAEGLLFSPEYIERGESLKLGDSGGTIETCIIKVPRTNPVALLYQGAPPELDKVVIEVFRIHGQATSDYIKIIDGTVSQVRFLDSTVELTITIENVLNRYIPRGTLSYNCQNCIYDEKCRLSAENYGFECTISNWDNPLFLHSYNLREKESGYFTDGYVRMGSSVRAIVKHEDDYIQIKYPINDAVKQANFTVYPGCSQVFKLCATRFHNTANFNGIPYIEPYNVYKHNGYSGRLPYWIDGNIVYRDTKGT